MKKVLLLLLFSTFLLAQSTPPIQWLHPKPFGISIGWLKAWNNQLIYGVGGAGNFLKSTNGGVTFTNNPNAGVPYNANPALSGDLYCGYFFDQNNGIVGGISGLMKTTDGGVSFFQIGSSVIPSAATVRSVNFLNNNLGLACGTSSLKAAVTTDGGTNWTLIGSLPATTFYTVVPLTTTKWIIGGSTSSSANIRITTDAGNTWTAVAAGTSTIYNILFTDSLTAYASAGSGGTFKSIDGGFSWSPLTTGAPTTSVFYSLQYDNGKLYFIDDDSTAYITQDGGATFSSVRYKKSLRTSSQIIRAAAVSGSQMVIAGDAGALGYSTDGGATWTTESNYTKGGFLQALWGDMQGKIIGAGTPTDGGSQVMVSDDYGKTWTAVNLSSATADIRGYYFFDRNTGFLVGSGANIWKTTDGGYNWVRYEGTLTIQAFSEIHFSSPLVGMISGNGGSIFRTTDGGITWNPKPIPGVTAGLNGIYMTDDNTAYVTGGLHVYKTTDGGDSWNQLTTGNTVSPTSAIYFRNPQVGYLIGGSGTSGTGFIYKTTDAGQTWVNKSFPYVGNMLYTAAFRSDSDYVVTGFGGGLFHTSNDGVSWKQLNLGIPNAVNAQVLGAHWITPDTLLLTGSNSTIILKVLFDPIVPVELASFTSSIDGNNVTLHWITATETNNKGFSIERSLINSNVWSTIADLPGAGTTTNQTSYSYTDGNLKSGTYLYRLKQTDYDGTLSYYNLTQQVEIGRPAEFALYQNYPNPFNPETKISFSLPSSEIVTIKLYDITGAEIRTLINSKLEAGFHTLTLQAENLPSGLYLYSMQAGSFSASKKLMLLK